MYDFATYFAWLVFALLFLALVALVVWLGSLPKKIALKRNHPQVDAINACSWIGLAVAGAGWPIAFVWAFLRSGPVGHDSSGRDPDLPESGSRPEEIIRLRDRVAELEHQLAEGAEKAK